MSRVFSNTTSLMMSVCMLYVGAMTTTLYPSQYADKLLKGDQPSKYFNSGVIYGGLCREFRDT